MSKDKLEFIEIGKIKPIKNRPLDEKSEEFKGLVASIREQGVIQPVLLRSNNGHFDLVAGGRRYHAAKIAGLELIPAHIRELSDEEMEMAQVTENVQRKDLEPWEEAQMYKVLIDRKQSPTEIAKKLGKSQGYVDNRFRLLNLIAPLMKAFQAGFIEFGSALLLSRPAQKIQEHIHEEIKENLKRIEKHGTDEGDKTINPTWIRNIVQKAMMKLNTAKFNVKDALLDPKAGACVSCPKNSVNMGQLFTDEENKTGVCTDIACWNNKTKIVLIKKITSAVEAGQVLGVTRYGSDNYKPLLAELGNPSVTDVSDLEEIYKPEKPKKYKGQSAKDLKNEMKDWENDMEQYKKVMASENKLHIFMLNGNDSGTVKVYHKKSAKAEAKDKKMNELPAKQQVARIEENLERRDDIARSNTTKTIYELLMKKKEEIVKGKKPLSFFEELGLLAVLSGDSHIVSWQKLNAYVKLNLQKKDKDFDAILVQMMRENLLKNISPQKESRDGARGDYRGELIHAIAKQYMPIMHEEELKKFKEEYDKRHQRAKERKAALK